MFFHTLRDFFLVCEGNSCANKFLPRLVTRHLPLRGLLPLLFITSHLNTSSRDLTGLYTSLPEVPIRTSWQSNSGSFNVGLLQSGTISNSSMQNLEIIDNFLD
jgi:hypothetical protein